MSCEYDVRIRFNSSVRSVWRPSKVRRRLSTCEACSRVSDWMAVSCACRSASMFSREALPDPWVVTNFNISLKGAELFSAARPLSSERVIIGLFCLLKHLVNRRSVCEWLIHICRGARARDRLGTPAIVEPSSILIIVSAKSTKTHSSSQHVWTPSTAVWAGHLLGREQVRTAVTPHVRAWYPADLHVLHLCFSRPTCGVTLISLELIRSAAPAVSEPMLINRLVNFLNEPSDWEPFPCFRV